MRHHDERHSGDLVILALFLTFFADNPWEFYLQGGEALAIGL